MGTGNTFTTPTVSAITHYFAETNNVACINAGGRVDVAVNISAPPTAQTMTGGGGYCTGASGIDVGLTTSEVGVNYQLKLEGVNTGSLIVGTGAAISFGPQTTGGTYTVSATNATGCTATMTGNKVISVSGTPTASVLAGGATICLGNPTNLNVAITGGAVPYSIVYNNGTADATVASYASGANISVSPTANTTYTLVSVTSSGACPSGGLSGTATVNVNAKPTASVLSGAATVCSGVATNLGVAITGGTSPYTVVYSGGTVSSYVSAANIAVSPTTTTSYTLTSVTDANGCVSTGLSSTASVTVNPTASTAVLSSSASIICSGTPINLNVAITGGTSPFTVVYSDGANQTVNSYTTGANIAIAPLSNTNYSLVSVTDASGCVATTPSGAPMVAVNQMPTTSVAGSAQSAAATAFTLAGNTPSVGIGTWTVVSGDAAIAMPMDAISTVSMPAGVATLRWTISNASACPASTSDMTLTSTIPVANFNTTLAGSCQAFTSVTIDATNNNVWVPLLENGTIVAAIKGNGNNLGTVSGSYFINSSGTMRSTATTKYMDRNIGISTQNAPSSPVSVRMYLSTAEWNALVAAIPTVADNAFSLSRLTGTCNTVFSGSGTIINGATIATINGYRVIQFSTSQFSDFYVTGQNLSLPIELKSLTATAKGQTNSVKWVTATELDMSEFIIERSADGRNAWTEMARVKATGTTQNEQTYQVTDNEPLTLSYYRLRSVETSGKFEVSKVVAVKRNGGKLTLLVVSPNPTTEGVTIDFSVGKMSKINVIVTDILGKVVKTETFTSVEGANNRLLNLSNLAQGTYILTLNDGETIAAQRIVKQ